MKRNEGGQKDRKKKEVITLFVCESNIILREYMYNKMKGLEE